MDIHPASARTNQESLYKVFVVSREVGHEDIELNVRALGRNHSFFIVLPFRTLKHMDSLSSHMKNRSPILSPNQEIRRFVFTKSQI